MVVTPEVPMAVEVQRRVPPDPFSKTKRLPTTELSHDPAYEGLRFMLRTICSDFDCYGETFAHNASTTSLQFVACHAPVSLTDDILSYAKTAPTESYLPGCGVPGIGWEGHGPELLKLMQLFVDAHVNDGGVRLELSTYIWTHAITIPTTFHTGDGMTVIYSKTGALRQYSVGNSTPVSDWPAFLSYVDGVKQMAVLRADNTDRRTLLLRGLRTRGDRNWRVFRIFLVFMMPMLVRHFKATGASIFRFTAGPDQRDPHDSFNKALQGKHKQNLGTQEKLSRVFSRFWWKAYFTKFKGGTKAMPKPMPWLETLLTGVTSFIGISTLNLIFQAINDTGLELDGWTNLFAFSGSFGALSTLVYTLPSAPLAQPRVMFPAHIVAIASGCAIVYIPWGRGNVVWLQMALSCAITIAAMAKLGIPHPPAGAFNLVFVGAYNKGSSNMQMLFIAISVLIGCAITVIYALVFNNLSNKRSFPAFW